MLSDVRADNHDMLFVNENELLTILVRACNLI